MKHLHEIQEQIQEHENRLKRSKRVKRKMCIRRLKRIMKL